MSAMTRPTSDQSAYLALVDPDASYRLAKRMERFKSNSVLGYRTAGSRAEFETGEMLLEEMRAIGLSDLRKDPFPVDGWEFRKARMQPARRATFCFSMYANFRSTLF